MDGELFVIIALLLMVMVGGMGAKMRDSMVDEFRCRILDLTLLPPLMKQFLITEQLSALLYFVPCGLGSTHIGRCGEAVTSRSNWIGESGIELGMGSNHPVFSGA